MSSPLAAAEWASPAYKEPKILQTALFLPRRPPDIPGLSRIIFNAVIIRPGKSRFLDRN